jgi:hypothetical protein
MPSAKASDRYLMYVDWSEEDQLYIGYCLDLFLGGICHADNRLEAYAKLMAIVEEDLAHRAAKGEPIPEPAARPSPPMVY